MSDINLRRHYNLYLSNTKDNSPGAGPYKLLLPDAPSFTGTPRQIMAEIAEFTRISGGCYISAVVIDPKTSERVSVDAIRFAMIEAETLAEYRTRR